MAWLLVDGRPVGPLQVAISFPARSRGLLGRDGIEGALLLQPASAVHTFRMRFAIDVAFCNRDLVVIDTVTMARNRLGRPRLRSTAVLEATAGAFADWALTPGSHLAVRETEEIG